MNPVELRAAIEAILFVSDEPVALEQFRPVFTGVEPGAIEAALTELQVGAEEAILVGDDLLDDIGGAQGAGIRGFLVRTGKFRPGDEAHPLVRPDGVFDDLAALVRHLGV